MFHTSSDTDLASDPAYQYHDDYQQDSGKSKEYDLSGYKRISPTPKFTLSHLYISPENAEPYFTRSVSKGSGGGYGDGYSAFIEKHFQDNDDDYDHSKVNENYRQNDDDEEVEVNSEYKQRHDSSDGDDDEEVNANYQQNNDDDNDNHEEVKSNYHHAPKVEVVESDRHYYGVGFDRIQSLPQKESTEHVKNCKIIVKGKAMCKLCKDPISGAHSESCSFSSAQPEHKYAFIKKEKYVS